MGAGTALVRGGEDGGAGSVRGSRGRNAGRSGRQEKGDAARGEEARTATRVLGYTLPARPPSQRLAVRRGASGFVRLARFFLASKGGAGRPGCCAHPRALSTSSARVWTAALRILTWAERIYRWGSPPLGCGRSVELHRQEGRLEERCKEGRLERAGRWAQLGEPGQGVGRRDCRTEMGRSEAMVPLSTSCRTRWTRPGLGPPRRWCWRRRRRRQRMPRSHLRVFIRLSNGNVARASPRSSPWLHQHSRRHRWTRRWRWRPTTRRTPMMRRRTVSRVSGDSAAPTRSPACRRSSAPRPNGAIPTTIGSSTYREPCGWGGLGRAADSRVTVVRDSTHISFSPTCHSSWRHGCRTPSCRASPPVPRAPASTRSLPDDRNPSSGWGISLPCGCHPPAPKSILCTCPSALQATARRVAVPHARALPSLAAAAASASGLGGVF